MPYDAAMDRNDIWQAIRRLLTKYPLGFSAPQLAEAVGLSRQSAHARLMEFVYEGYLVRAGAGRGTVYRAAALTPQHPNYAEPRGAVADVIKRALKYDPTIYANTSASFNSAWRPEKDKETSTG